MKDKICMICHTAIDMDKEFCTFEHHENKDVIKSKGWYHVNCFRDRLNSSKEQSDALKLATNTLKQMKEKMGLQDEQEVVIV